MSLWDRCICALVFDGQPLGNHQLPHDKEGNKRINEMIGIAGALVGATVDREIRCLRSLPARHGVATTDFEADLRDGRTLRLETCALVDVTQQRYVNATRAIMQRVNAAIGTIPAAFSAGKYFVRCYGRPLEATDIGPVSIELTEFLIKSGPTLPLTRSMTKIGAPYTILERLNTHVCRLNDGGKTGVVLEPLMHLLGNTRPRDVFPTLFAQKAAKYNEYSDGGAVAVWLAMYVHSPMTLAYGDVEMLIATTPDPRPFDRLIIGSKTVGRAFDAAAPPGRAVP
jgi:hypothetical protein